MKNSLSFERDSLRRDAVQGYLTHKKQRPLSPYSRTMPKALWWSQGEGLFPMSELPLHKSIEESSHSKYLKVHVR